VTLFVGLVAIACRALQKVSEPVEMHFLQWHSALISIQHTHLDLCTASNVHEKCFVSDADQRRVGSGRIAEIHGRQAMLLRHCGHPNIRNKQPS